MGPNRSDKHLGFADLMSISVLSIAGLLILVTTETASPMTLFIVIAIVCGVGLAVGALLADAVTIQSRREEKRPINYRETRA